MRTQSRADVLPVASVRESGSGRARAARTRPQLISVIVPMLNEAAHLDDFVADLAAQDFEGDVEIFVADGGSTDGSAERLTALAQQNGLRLTVLPNPRRWVAPGLNACLRHATGDLVIRLDCHARYPSDYFSACVRISEATGAWNVGGLFTVAAQTPHERAFACAIESPFGGHNWTRKRDVRHEADTVFCGAFRREALELVGGYDESLAVTEVEDLNIRLREAGGRVVFDPTIRLTYVPRRTLKDVFRQYYRYGLWKVPVVVKHRQVASGRSAVPIVFVSSFAILATASPFSGLARLLLAGEVAAYAIAALGFGAIAIRRRRESLALLPRVVAHFPIFHVAHGLGGLHGWLRTACGVFR